MRLLPTVTLIVLTGSALALIKYTSYDDETLDEDSRSHRRDNRNSSESDTNRNIEESSDGVSSILHRFKRNLFSWRKPDEGKSDYFGKISKTTPF